MIWRVGRKVGRTIYEQEDWEPKDGDTLIGVMDTPQLAKRVVDSVNAMSPAPTLSVDLEKLKMVTELDTAMHGQTIARNASPQEVWNDLLGKVRMSRDAHLNRVTELETGGRAARDSLKAKITEHRVKNDVLREMVERLESQVEHLETDRDQVVKQHDDLKEKTKYREELIKAQGEKIDLLYKEIGEMGDSIAANTAVMDLAAQNEASYVKQLAKRELEQHELSVKVTEFVAENIDLRNTIIQRDAEIRKVGIECYRLNQANTKLKQDLAYAEVQLKQHEGDAKNQPENLTEDITRALNYWSMDSKLDTPDFILAKYLVQALNSLVSLQRSVKRWEGRDTPGIQIPKVEGQIRYSETVNEFGPE